MKKLSILILLGFCLSACAAQSRNSAYRQQQNQLSCINVQMGLLYLQQGQRPQAKEKLMAALNENPRSGTAMDAMAYFWEITGNNDLADQYYQKAIVLNPDSGRFQNNYGAYLCRMKQYAAAERYLLAAGRSPVYVGAATAMENAGLCALAAKQPIKAENYFKQALQQDPSLAASQLELARLNRD